jgi:hypothetical protein
MVEIKAGKQKTVNWLPGKKSATSCRGKSESRIVIAGRHDEAFYESETG